MGHLSAKARASSNKKIKVTHFREISKSLERLFSWSHSGLFLGLMQCSQMEANCLCSKTSPFPWSMALAQDSVRRNGCIHMTSLISSICLFTAPAWATSSGSTLARQLVSHSASVYWAENESASQRMPVTGMWSILRVAGSSYYYHCYYGFFSDTRPWALSSTVLRHSLST